MTTFYLVSQTDVRRRLGNVSNMTIHRWRKAGILPEPVVIAGRNYWHEHVIEALARNGASQPAQSVAA